jgi:hypothetical protein
MSESNPESEAIQTEAEGTPETPLILPRNGWFQRLTSVLFIIFCFELGLFLLIYPWTDSWSDNYIGWMISGRYLENWHTLWDNGYFRGGLSGLGLLNLWIALAELFSMFSRRPEPPH